MSDSTDLPRFIVYRSGGCRQYCFYTHDELAAWASRKPYRTEVLRVLPILSDGQLGDCFEIIGSLLASWAAAHAETVKRVA